MLFPFLPGGFANRQLREQVATLFLPGAPGRPPMTCAGSVFAV